MSYEITDVCIVYDKDVLNSQLPAETDAQLKELVEAVRSLPHVKTKRGVFVQMMDVDDFLSNPKRRLRITFEEPRL